MITLAIIMTYFIQLLSTSLMFVLIFFDRQKQVRALTKPDPAAVLASVTHAVWFVAFSGIAMDGRMDADTVLYDHGEYKAN